MFTPTLFKRSNGIYYAILTDEEDRRKWISTHQRRKSLALQAFANASTAKQSTRKKTNLQEFLSEFIEHKKTIYSDGTIQV